MLKKKMNICHMKYFSSLYAYLSNGKLKLAQSGTSACEIKKYVIRMFSIIWEYLKILLQLTPSTPRDKCESSYFLKCFISKEEAPLGRILPNNSCFTELKNNIVLPARNAFLAFFLNVWPTWHHFIPFKHILNTYKAMNS